MELAVTIRGWQFILLAHLEKLPHGLKLPTIAELKAMKKAAYRRFREAIKAQREPVKYVAHRKIWG